MIIRIISLISIRHRISPNLHFLSLLLALRRLLSIILGREASPLLVSHLIILIVLLLLVLLWLGSRFLEGRLLIAIFVALILVLWLLTLMLLKCGLLIILEGGLIVPPIVVVLLVLRLLLELGSLLHKNRLLIIGAFLLAQTTGLMGVQIC